MIIGLSGTNGAGKDTVGEILRDDFGFLFVSGTDMLRKEAQERGLEVSRDNLRNISSEWKKERGPGAFVIKIVEAYEEELKGYRGLVVSSLRHPDEAKKVQELGGLVVWVDADPQLRYQRVQTADRGRSAEDQKTFEEFVEEEKAEMTPEGNPQGLNMQGVKDISDITILNEINGLENFARLIEQKLDL